MSMMNNNENILSKTTCMAIMRCTWDHRNHVLFLGVIVDGEEIFGIIQLY